MLRSGRAIPMVTASALALLTLAVFWFLRESGPESAVRKFHIAVVNGDTAVLEDLLAAGSSRYATSYLVAVVANYARAGAQFRIHGTARGTEATFVEVDYVVPRRTPVPVLWATMKQGGRWRIHPDLTLRTSLER